MDYYILDGKEISKIEQDPEMTEGDRYNDALDHAVNKYIETHDEVKLLIDVATVNDDKYTFAKNIQLNAITMEWTDKKG